jgi:hypothetical protein
LIIYYEQVGAVGMDLAADKNALAKSELIEGGDIFLFPVHFHSRPQRALGTETGGGQQVLAGTCNNGCY